MSETKERYTIEDWNKPNLQLDEVRKAGEYGWVPIEEILDHPLNWVEHPPEQIADYRRSLAEFGPVGDVVLNLQTGHLIDGHMRVGVDREDGKTRVRCFFVDLDQHKEERLLLALRKVGQMAERREEVLKDLLLAHMKDAEGLPPGWDAEEIGLATNGFSKAELEEHDLLHQAPAPPSEAEAPTRTKFGEIYRLDKHIVIIGDSTNTVTIVEALQQMGVGKVDLIFADPPYNILLSNTSGNFPDKDGVRQGPRPAYAKLKLDGIDRFNPVEDWLPTMPLWFGWKGERPGPEESYSLYVYCNDALVADYTGWSRAMRGTVACLVWEKPRQPIPFANHHWVDTENLLWLKKRAKWNEVDKAPDANRKKCLHDAEISPEQDDSDCPCPKPVSQIANQLLLTTDPGEVVVDPFGWTGPTLMACEETGRRCIYIERNPRGADVCLLWWERMTNSKAVLISKPGDDNARE